jgi:hypothetical protein
MIKSAGINRAALTSATLTVALVLSGCGRFPRHPLVGSYVQVEKRSSSVGQLEKRRRISPQPTYAVRKATTVGDTPLGVSIEAPTDHGRLDVVHDDVPIQGPMGSQPEFFAGTRPGESLPMKPMFHPDETTTKETEDEARLRKIMRICAC